MAVVLTCPKCGHKFNPESITVKDPNELEKLIAMGVKETCPNCSVVSTFDSSMFEWKSD
jgi:predicted RNA-binding Zn-ribbon protein involved in translation (DUF1610 family)